MFWASPHLMAQTLGHALTLADAGGPLWLLPHIAIGPETLFKILGFPITNTLLSAWLSMVIVLGLFIPATRKMSIVPKGLQNFVEWAASLLFDFCVDVAGREKARKFFPLIATIFFYVLFANWLSIIPGTNSIGTPEGVTGNPGIFLTGDNSNKLIPWLRPASTDINFTLALAIVSVIATQIYSFQALGFFGQVGKYFNFHGPIDFFVGILEIVAEFARVLSLSFRLFGNVFAGDLLLVILGTLLPVVGPAVFYPLEFFVGFIQAFVFAALTLVFSSLGTESHAAESHGDAATAHH